ncbi:MAG: ArsR/SmtB family transcription factor [Planctomycetota bacterium]
MEPRSADRGLDCAGKLKLLADATRLAVVEILMAGPRHVGELTSILQVDQSLLSHHLRALRDGGLVAASRDGKAVLYRLAPGVEVRRSGRVEAIDLGCCRLSFEAGPGRQKGRRCCGS